MKWMALLLTLLLAACGINNTDNVAYRQVVVPSTNNLMGLWNNNSSIDVTTTTIKSR